MKLAYPQSLDSWEAEKHAQEWDEHACELKERAREAEARVRVAALDVEEAQRTARKVEDANLKAVARLEQVHELLEQYLEGSMGARARVRGALVGVLPLLHLHLVLSSHCRPCASLYRPQSVGLAMDPTFNTHTTVRVCGNDRFQCLEVRSHDGCYRP